MNGGSDMARRAGQIAVTRMSDIAADYAPSASDGAPAGWIPLAILAVAVTATTAMLTWWYRRRAVSASGAGDSLADSLTEQLCKAYGLDAAERAALIRLTRCGGCQHPGELFLSVAMFDEAVDRAGWTLKRRDDATGRLRRMLFA